MSTAVVTMMIKRIPTTTANIDLQFIDSLPRAVGQRWLGNLQRVLENKSWSISRGKHRRVDQQVVPSQSAKRDRPDPQHVVRAPTGSFVEDAECARRSPDIPGKAVRRPRHQPTPTCLVFPDFRGKDRCTLYLG